MTNSTISPHAHVGQLTAEFLSILHQGGTYSYWWTPTPRRSTWWPVEVPEPLPNGHSDIYFGIHPVTEIPPVNAQGEPRPPEHVRSQIRYVAAVNCLFAEFDAKRFGGDKTATLWHIEQLPIQPSVIIDSGGGYHCYWLLDEPWLLQDDSTRKAAQDLQARGVEYVQSDSAAKDLARVLRVPETKNYKYEPARDVQFVRCNLTQQYTLADLEHVTPIDAGETRSSEAAVATRPAEHVLSWASGVKKTALEMIACAPDGEKHGMRLKVARLYGGLIPLGLATDDEAEAAIYHAQPPKANQRSELKTIRDAIAHGKAEPLTPPPAPPTPATDQYGAACCPSGHGQLVPSKNGNGLRCPSFCGFWWKGEGYVLPERTNGHIGMHDQTQADDQPQPRKLIHASELNRLPPSEWLIENVLLTNKITQLFAMPGEGKSFTSLDMSLSVAQIANVIYIAAEDAEDYQVRVEAWCKHHNATPGGLHFWPEAVNLFNQAEIDAFLAEIRPLDPALIVIDPLANCMVGSDESSTRDMNIAVETLNYIRRQTTAAILINHHTGWNDAHERGSSVLRGACRVVMKLTNNDGFLTLSCEKINGAKAFAPRYFRLVPSGESVVLVPTTKLSNRDGQLSQQQIDVLDALYLSVFADGASQSQLVEHLVVAKSSMHYSLSRLLDHGAVTKEGKGHATRYRITDSGIDILLAAQSEAVQSRTELSMRTTELSPNFAELSLNWQVKAEALVQSKVQSQKASQSQSSDTFSKSSAKVQPEGKSSVQSPPLRGTEQLNPERPIEPNTPSLVALGDKDPPAPTVPSVDHNGHKSTYDVDHWCREFDKELDKGRYRHAETCISILRDLDPDRAAACSRRLEVALGVREVRK